MSMYTVHIPQTAALPQEETAQAVCVAEGFSRAAFVLAPVWCAFRRSWLGLALWALGVVAILLAARWLEAAPVVQFAGIFSLHVLFGLEAAQLRRRSLARRGYALVDVASADNEDDARLTFDLRRLGAPASQPVVQTFASQRTRPVRPEDGIGLAPLGGGA